MIPLKDVFRANMAKLADRLSKRVQQRGPNDCWLFDGARDADGYGRLRVLDENGVMRQFTAHRLTVALRVAEWPDTDVLTLHSCDNPPCCNPGHLSTGTVQQNSDDCVSRNRQARGATSGRAKLSEEQVKEIKNLLIKGECSENALVKQYNISRGAIQDIKHGRKWRHVIAGALLFLLCALPVDAKEICIASYYGDWHHGRVMANGQRFNKDASTVAHKRLPLGSYVLILNPENNRSVIARVTDRGPYIHGRCLDVSEAIARMLGFHDRGIIRLSITPIQGPRRT